MFLTQLKKKKKQTLFLSRVVALTVEMVPCFSQAPACAGSQTSPCGTVAVAEPSPCTPTLGPFLSSWARRELPRLVGAQGGAPVRLHLLSPPVRLRDWDPEIRRSSPCFPSWLGSANLTVKKKNAVSVQIHPYRGNPMLACLLAPKADGI